MDLHDEIKKVVRELYEKSGRIKGSDLDNWLEAERIVMARYSEQAGTKKSAPRKKTSTEKKTVIKKKTEPRKT
jgi:hypothetical protein